MMVIPLQIDVLRYDLFVVLEDENLERIKKKDPAEIVGRNLGQPWTFLRMRNVVIVYATAEESKSLSGCPNKAEMLRQLKQLSSGWEFRPDRGDGDSQYPQPNKN